MQNKFNENLKLWQTQFLCRNCSL